LPFFLRPIVTALGVVALAGEIAPHALGFEQGLDFLCFREGIVFKETQFGREFHRDHVPHLAADERLVAIERCDDPVGILSTERFAETFAWRMSPDGFTCVIVTDTPSRSGSRISPRVRICDSAWRSISPTRN
jgi:hypothetical protein